jgi:hypothetical protein
VHKSYVEMQKSKFRFHSWVQIFTNT